MKSSLLLTAALVLLLPAAPCYAQGVETTSNTRAGRRAAEQREAARKGTPKAAEQVAQYPNATRESPKPLGDKSVAKDMAELIKLQGEDGAEDRIIARADAVLANPKASAYDKSTAAYLAGAAWQGKEAQGYANPSKYYQIAIDNNGLDNNTHYRAMLQVAQMYDADGKGEQALKMVDRFLAETKSEDANALAIKTQILLSMDNPAQAAAMLEKQLVAKPNDKRTMLNLAALYMEAGQDAKAGQMFDKMRAAGLLTESKDYEVGFRLLANIEGREKDALTLIDEGLAKKILQPSYEMYALQGRSYWEADNVPKAIEAWTLGAPMAKDGEMWLNVAKLQLDADRYADAKVSAQKAREKGVKKMGDYYQVIARAENFMGNKAASRAAMQEAAKYPETQKWAEAALRQGLGK